MFIHDQGTEFINGVNSEPCRLMDISKRIATAYHPMTNSLDERWNGTPSNSLAPFIDPIMAAYWPSKHEYIAFSPYFTVFHKEPCLSVNVSFVMTVKH